MNHLRGTLTIMTLCLMTACATSGSGSKKGSTSEATAKAAEQSELKAPLMTSSKVSAAEGFVQVGETKNDNTLVDLQVKHLGKPEKVDAMATTYVVWQRIPQDANRVVNLGALNVDQDLNAQLETVTPLKNFEIFVTAEPSSTASRPSGERLLWTVVSR